MKLINVNYDLGMNYFETGYNALALTHFEKCLETYKLLYEKPGEQFSNILYKIALSLKKLKKFDMC